MRIIKSKTEMRQACQNAPRPLGLIPTMGALHAGHLSLVDRARVQCASIAASIFVNPTQFGQNEDFAQYPRNLDADLQLLQQHGVDLAFVPDASEIYPPGFAACVDPGPLANRLEGAARPGHFRGVATVVTKLFTITRPDFAYFGQKDGQQTIIIRRITQDLDLGVAIIIMPTIREPDGLAMSSRNARLTPQQRQAAPTLYRALQAGNALWQANEKSAAMLRGAVMLELQSEPLLYPIDYISIAHPETLDELRQPIPGAMLSAAAQLGQVRLIDNLLLDG